MIKLNVPAAACCLCALVMLCGCNGSDSSSSAAVSGSGTTTTSTRASAEPSSQVEVRDYSFPEFMSDERTGDMLANVVSESFSYSQSVSTAEASPSQEHQAELCLLGEYYTFTEDGFVGLMNSYGTVILPADTYTDLRLVSNELVLLSYPDSQQKEPELMQIRDGSAKAVESSFSTDNIEIREVSPDTEEAPDAYCMYIRGRADTGVYDSIEPLSQGSLSTSRMYSAAYKASVGGRYYYLVLDEYYNITVCEAAYAQVRLKVAGSYGECYILNGDDNNELNKMIKSFGAEQQNVKPSKDENLDYIQIVFGICSGDQLTVTVSADGFCLTDGLTVKGQPANKFFTVYSKDAFADLVNWVGEVLSLEYASGEEN
ncbi:MAG: hypothetical protein IJ561_02940 [Ruminococcus sp.]|nr:hypothetical protein [Ruminococcus sp.]